MNENESLYELADEYLSGGLSGKAKADFEKLMQENPALKAHTEKMRRVNELLFMEGLRSEIPNIKAAEKQYMFRQQWTQYGKWFGTILIIAAVGTSVWVFSGSKNEKTSAASVNNTKKEQTIISSGDKNAPEIVTSAPENTSPVTLYAVPLEKSTLAPVVIQPNSNTPFVPISEMQIRAMEHDRDTTIKANYNTGSSPCVEMIKAEVTTLPSCSNKNDGTIALENISGKSPYKTNLSNLFYHEDYIMIHSLQAGTYEIIITDSYGCSSGTLKITVPEKSCIEKRDAVFSYSVSGTWEFPEMNETNYTFHIYNRTGTEIYSVQVENDSPSSWDGYGSNGQKLPMGVYPYRFEREGKIILEGSITVVE